MSGRDDDVENEAGTLGLFASGWVELQSLPVPLVSLEDEAPTLDTIATTNASAAPSQPDMPAPPSWPQGPSPSLMLALGLTLFLSAVVIALATTAGVWSHWFTAAALLPIEAVTATMRSSQFDRAARYTHHLLGGVAAVLVVALVGRLTGFDLGDQCAVAVGAFVVGHVAGRFRH